MTSSVLSTIGSFTNLAGGNVYPSLIRKTERKPLRVYQEDSTGDVDNQFGNWPIANQQVHAALKYMGYDCRFDYAALAQGGCEAGVEPERRSTRGHDPAPAADRW